MPFVDALKADLEAQRYDGEPVRVRVDDRDIRGGEKKWQWVKRGVPLRVEIGPRDVADAKAFVARRDVAGKGEGLARDAFVARVPEMLADMQQSLFDRAAKAREEATVRIDSLADFEAFFADDAPGGLAWCHFIDTPEIEPKLKELKVTARCVPLAGDDEPGECIFTGKPSPRRGVFARAY